MLSVSFQLVNLDFLEVGSDTLFHSGDHDFPLCSTQLMEKEIDKCLWFNAER